MAVYESASECLRAHGFEQDAQVLDELNTPTPYQAWHEQHAEKAVPGEGALAALLREARNQERYAREITRPTNRAILDLLRSRSRVPASPFDGAGQ